MENTTRILVGVGAGLATGILLGVLFAPNKGTETRKKIKDAGNKLSDNVKQTIQRGKDGLYSFKEGIKERLDSINESAEDYI
jgi:gas vesicle protein